MCLGQNSRPARNVVQSGLFTPSSVAVGAEQRQGDDHTKEIFVQSVQANFPIGDWTFPSHCSVPMWHAIERGMMLWTPEAASAFKNCREVNKTTNTLCTCSVTFLSSVKIQQIYIYLGFHDDEVEFRLNNGLAAFSKLLLLLNKTFKVTRRILEMKIYWI